LPTFYIGKFPVKATEVCQFVIASGKKLGDEDALRGAVDHPAVLVSWYEALDYANWYGFSLPSEAEWEKAARGDDGREYPWGSEWEYERANTAEFWSYPLKQVGRTTPVGQFSPAGDSPYGCVDMMGNVCEWTRSLWGHARREADFQYPYVGTDGRE